MVFLRLKYLFCLPFFTPLETCHQGWRIIHPHSNYAPYQGAIKNSRRFGLDESELI